MLKQSQPFNLVRATIITDASWCPETGAAGYGLWIAGSDGRIKKHGPFATTFTSSLDAELAALVQGVFIALSAGYRNILAQSDCTGALKRLTVEQLNKCGVETPHSLLLTTRHVKGHTSTKDSRSFVNRWCDKKAIKHMRERRNLIKTNESN